MNAQQELFERAMRVMPGGVCSSARAKAALGHPFYVAHGYGSKLYDLEDRATIDMSVSHGASLLGHHHPAISEAIRKAVSMGTLCSMETPHHAELAEMLCDMVPCLDMVRFTGSGTEATMHCLRAARAYTGRDVVVKFEGHFHGLHDYVQFNWFPESIEPAPGYPRPLRHESEGIPEGMGRYMMVLPFNDRAAVEAAFAARGDEIAAVILEPINYNAGCILPVPGTLEFLREECTKRGIVLIFDEVLSGFRTGTGCAQGRFGVTPDLCCLGKALGGGAPLSAFGGRREIMETVAPLGRSSHSGTYNGHLFQILPGIAALKEYSQPGFYDKINHLSWKLYRGANAIFGGSKILAHVQGLGARFGFYFGIREEVRDYATASRKDRRLEESFKAACFRRGVYFDANWHAGISIAHSEVDIDRVLMVFAEAVQELESQIRTVET